jgi:hypothetical protein
LVATALVGVDDDDAVGALVDGVGVARANARGIIAVLADAVFVRDLDLGNLAPDVVVDLFQNWPVSGCGLAIGDQSLATCSSLQEIWQL